MTPESDLCMQYTIRVAYLHSLIDLRVQSARLKHTGKLPHTASAGPSRRSHDGTSSFFAFDLGSLVARDAFRSPKYPEKLLKVLDGALQRVAMGQESKYADQRFRRTVARFWSSTWPEKTFQRQARESRKAEDLILAFVTSATKTLQKDEDLASGAWKWELSVQVALFLNVFSDSLLAIGPVSVELSSRLDSYRARLTDTTPLEKVQKPVEGGDHETEETEIDYRVKQATKDDLLKSVASKIGRLFGASDDKMHLFTEQIRDVCSEQAALDDLKTCLKLLNTGSSYPYSRQDFADDSQWNTWRSSEVATLSQMMLGMMQANATLSQTSDRDSLSDLSFHLENTQFDDSVQRFTYIPSEARTQYCELLDRCLDWDLNLLKDLPEDEDVSLGILSQENAALLGECAMRWRLPSTFQSTVFFGAILDRYEHGEVPSACVHEAIGMSYKIQEENPLSSWSIIDTIERRNACFIQAVNSGLDLPRGYHSDEFLDAVVDWVALDLHEHCHGDYQTIATQIEHKIQAQAFTSYTEQASIQLDREGLKTSSFALQLAAWIEKEAKKLDRNFKQPIIRQVDVVALVLRQHLTLWHQDLEDTVQVLMHAGAVDSMEDLFVLYRKAVKLSEMRKAFLSPEQSYDMPLTDLFEHVVGAWLDQTAMKTKVWADQALAVDRYQPMSTNGPSSSVTDLFDSFRSAIAFLMDLQWPDEQELAVFATRLAKIISLSISDYCNKIEKLFAADMRQVETTQTVAKQKAWLEKAKATIASLQALQGERRIQAFFNFTPESCVKLNNIEAARQQLDKLYDQLRVDDLSAYETAVSPSAQTQQTFLFTVKIVLAEGLTIDGSGKLPDSFVILSDEHGTRYAKSRTIYDDSDPRWDESFDVTVKGSAWFMATVRHRSLSGKHELLGRAYLRLDPSQHEDLMSKDILLPLDSRGHILLRVSMEGERDDIQFHFGRAFRWLKRTESDMVRTFVDKMTPVLRHTLSKASIRSVIKPTTSNGLDYNEALVKLSAAYRSALGAPEYVIPPTKEERQRGPSDADIETAIHPLFDYLDTNNHTLASTLSAAAMQMVMAKLWKQILMTIEGLIVPPLSDKPSHMRALSDGELDIALKWLKFLRDFLYVGGDASGVPLNTLQNAKFNEILSVRIYYDWNTDDLMEECIRGFQSTLKYRSTRPSKSLLSQRNLGTIRARKSAKRAAPTSAGNTEMIMRILRMRQGTQEFLAQQIQTLSVVRLENPKKGRSLYVRSR